MLLSANHSSPEQLPDEEVARGLRPLHQAPQHALDGVGVVRLEIVLGLAGLQPLLEQVLVVRVTTGT